MKQKNFETSLGQLEKIVRELEQGDLSLEESLALFEEGVKLSRECQERLNQAERRIEVLMRDTDGSPLLETIDGEPVSNSKQPKITKRVVFENDLDDDE